MGFKLSGEFGEPFFEGTEHEAKMIKNAMVKYGILERKLHITPPDNTNFKLPEESREEILDALANDMSECGCDRDYDAEKDWLNSKTDLEIAEYLQTLWGEESGKYVEVVENLLATYKLEKALAEG